nr:germin-like protein subfamily 1 member 7 [Quercus suber]
MMKGVHYLVTVTLLALASTLAFADDPSPLQDFCVAINNTDYAVFVNGKFCKDPMLTTADDFFFSGLDIPRNTKNKLGLNINLVNVDKLVRLNTLVLEGTLLVGFVTSNPNYHLFTKTLNQGDVFVFPVGLIHFQFNIGDTNAIAFSSFSSQNPGTIRIANAVFGSNPPINSDVLIKAFQVDKNVVDYLQKIFHG